MNYEPSERRKPLTEKKFEGKTHNASKHAKKNNYPPLCIR